MTTTKTPPDAPRAPRVSQTRPVKLNRLADVARVIAPLVSGFPAPWAVAGGWALDLFLGRTTRPHADLELAIFREDQLRLRRHLLAWACEKVVVVDGRREIRAAGETLTRPVHEVHARLGGEPAYALEFLLNERAGGSWAFRRTPSVTLPLDRAILPAAGAARPPVLAPEIVPAVQGQVAARKGRAGFPRGPAGAGRPAPPVAHRRAHALPSRAPLDRRACGNLIQASPLRHFRQTAGRQCEARHARSGMEPSRFAHPAGTGVCSGRVQRGDGAAQ